MKETILRSRDEKPVGDANRIRGYAAVFNQQTRIMDSDPVTGSPRTYFEQISRNAFDAVIARRPDVIVTFNHDLDCVLGQTSNGTATIGIDDTGLWYECSLTYLPGHGKRVTEAMMRGEVRGASFVAVILADEWQGNVRTLTELDLIEVGPVRAAAYRGSSAELVKRSAEMHASNVRRIQQRERNLKRFKRS